MKKSLLFILMGIALIVAGCGGPSGEPAGTQSPALRRIIDDEAGVVCWYLLNSSHISCLPIADTKLPRG